MLRHRPLTLCHGTNVHPEYCKVDLNKTLSLLGREALQQNWKYLEKVRNETSTDHRFLKGHSNQLSLIPYRCICHTDDSHGHLI